ncbi:F-box/kelch-repeat protein [Gossypium australe]|uniref:F-box/kelch-repeat protein n=1 Tax=Gossypium australe TaxID=47621 RepID=A0A5B6VPV4_9ROSI|nr:F-box/kelch-repeat protein [Gossypium australe]
MNMKYIYRLNRRDQMTSRDWTDLPLLPSIVDSLGLIDLLRFRVVCKDWNSSSFATTTEIEAIPDQEPWCLIYGGNNSECSLITESDGKHTIYIPEMNGATYLASSQGWLLLFREGSMFFFCPLSDAKIDLPGPFPHTAIDDHVAVFSALPTSKDCVVAVSDSMVYMSIEKRELRLGKVRYMKSAKDKSIPLRFSTNSEKENMKKQLGLEDGVQVSTCGTVVSCESSADKMVPYENTGVGADDAEGRQIVEAVWF